MFFLLFRFTLTLMSREIERLLDFKHDFLVLLLKKSHEKLMKNWLPNGRNGKKSVRKYGFCKLKGTLFTRKRKVPLVLKKTTNLKTKILIPQWR